VHLEHALGRIEEAEQTDRRVDHEARARGRHRDRAQLQHVVGHDHGRIEVLEGAIDRAAALLRHRRLVAMRDRVEEVAIDAAVEREDVAVHAFERIAVRGVVERVLFRELVLGRRRLFRAQRPGSAQQRDRQQRSPEPVSDPASAHEILRCERCRGGTARDGIVFGRYSELPGGSMAGDDRCASLEGRDRTDQSGSAARTLWRGNSIRVPSGARSARPPPITAATWIGGGEWKRDWTSSRSAARSGHA
jgi:hypothetical protein